MALAIQPAFRSGPESSRGLQRVLLDAYHIPKKADTARRTRRPFTVDEIQQILSACGDEWRGLVIFALHTGQRLGDLARLTRANVDETHGTLNLTNRKRVRGSPSRCLQICERS